MKNKTVSVIIPTYKRPDTLSRAIHTVLNQTYPCVEAIVVDDNDPNSEGRQMTEVVMAEFSNNNRVRYIKHPFNKNGSAARNTGARNSNSDYLAFLDDDDEFLPDKIDYQVKLLESLDLEWGCCYSRIITKRNGANEVLGKESRQGKMFKEALARDFIIGAGSNLLVRRSVFDEVGGFNETFKRNQDIELLSKILFKYKIAFSSEPGVVINVHTESRKVDYVELTNQYIAAFQPMLEKMDKKDQQWVMECLNLQTYFYELRVEKHYVTCIKAILSGKLSVIKFVKYFIKHVIKSLRNR